MKIGFRLHDLGTGSPAKMSKKSGELGFDGVALCLNKALTTVSALPGTFKHGVSRGIRNAFDKEDVKIFLLESYINPLHPVVELVVAYMYRLRDHIRYCKDFDCRFVGTGSGSRNDDYSFNKENRTDRAFLAVCRVFKNLLACAKRYKRYIAIEGGYNECLYSPSRLYEFVRKMDNGYLFVTMDILNFLSIDNYDKQIEIFDEAISLLKNKIVFFQFRDFIVEGDKLVQVPLGTGIMRLDYMIPIVKKECPYAYWMLDGEREDTIMESLNYLKKHKDGGTINENGSSLCEPS